MTRQSERESESEKEREKKHKYSKCSCFNGWNVCISFGCLSGVAGTVAICDRYCDMRTIDFGLVFIFEIYYFAPRCSHTQIMFAMRPMANDQWIVPGHSVEKNKQQQTVLRFGPF